MATIEIPPPGTPAGSDPDAIHDNVAGEILPIAGKATPVNADVLLIEDSAAGYAKKSVLWSQLPGGGGGGLTSIDTQNTVWVDGTNGNDGTGTSGRQDLPFATVAAALLAASAGDVVLIRPGTYGEAGLAIPPNVTVRGYGWKSTRVGAPAAASNTFTLSAFGGAIHDLDIICPVGAGFAGLVHSGGTANATGLNFTGDGLAGAGDGIYKTGTGKLIGGSLRFETGGLNAGLRVDAGVLALDDVHFPQAAGSIGAAVLAEGTGTFQCQGFNCGNSNVVDAIQLAGTATCRVYSPNIFNVSNAVHITADGPTLTLVSGNVSASLRTVWVDPLLTGTGTTVRALSTVIDPLFDFPPAAAPNTDFVLAFNQKETLTRDSRQRLIGADMALGFPELGSAFSVGKGAPYSDGIQVVTTDGTETMVGSVVAGGNQTDVTAAAQSRSASTYSFQGTAVNNAIYFGSLRRDGSSVPLKHWGHVISQVAAGVGGSYVFEIWDGAAWAAVGVMAVSTDEEYRYADAVFLRASSEEELFFGIVASTTWAQATVNGVAGYYIRARVATTLTTAPTFERCKFSESSTAFNKTGQRSARGLAQWKLVFSAVGFRWSGTGTSTGAIPMGTGAVAWGHELEQGKLNSNGDDAYIVLALPQGICTAHPVRVRLIYSYQVFDALPTLGIDLKICEVAGSQVADPAGGIAPIVRTPAATAATDATPGTNDSFTGLSVPINTLARYESIPFDVSGFYEDDIAAIRVTLVADGGGTGTDVLLLGVELEGLKFTDGALGS